MSDTAVNPGRIVADHYDSGGNLTAEEWAEHDEDVTRWKRNDPAEIAAHNAREVADQHHPERWLDMSHPNNVQWFAQQAEWALAHPEAAAEKAQRAAEAEQRAIAAEAAFAESSTRQARWLTAKARWATLTETERKIALVLRARPENRAAMAATIHLAMPEGWDAK